VKNSTLHKPHKTPTEGPHHRLTQRSLTGGKVLGEGNKIAEIGVLFLEWGAITNLLGGPPSQRDTADKEKKEGGLVFQGALTLPQGDQFPLLVTL